jgi:hypothetical protein
VIDTAMVDGASYLMSMVYGQYAGGLGPGTFTEAWVR